MTTMQLYVWGPALGAPSIDAKCIVVEAYLRVSGANFTVVHANDPQSSPTGELPLLKDGSVWVAGMDRIMTHLAKRGLDANEGLSPEAQADYIAYSALAQDSLHDCMLYTWYADLTNFVKSIRPTYAQLLSFPSRYLVPVFLKKSAKARLEKYGVEIKSDDATLPQNEKEEMSELMKTGWHHMYSLARETYAVLDNKLGDQPYMFGDRPTTLDCLVFGHLALHLYPDLAHRRLQHILKTEYPRLASFCDRFRETYFIEEPATSQPAEDVPSFWKTIVSHPRDFFTNVRDTYWAKEKTEKSAAQLDFERKRIWSIAGGVTFLLAYVIYNGIVRVEFNDEAEEYEEEELEEDA